MADVRLIDADALLDYLANKQADCDSCTDVDCLNCVIEYAIKPAPAINPDDLRPQGRWITHDNGITECSECHTLGSPQWKCCPVCTAMMDGKENEDA